MLFFYYLILINFIATAIPIVKDDRIIREVKNEFAPFDRVDSSAKGSFFNMDVDGVEMLDGKSTQIFDQIKEKQIDDEKQIGEKPQLTKDTLNTADITSTTTELQTDSMMVDYFGEESGPITNPAATYLAGSNFENVSAPKCQIVGCTGPLPNDGSFSQLETKVGGKACGQVFVAMNGCIDNKGYPVGMMCSICCDCVNDFIVEMKKTFGYKEGITASR